MVDGTILIDKIDTVGIELDLLRSKISYISQDPIMLTETLRTNLDINNKYTDDTLWDALEQVTYFFFIEWNALQKYTYLY